MYILRENKRKKTRIFFKKKTAKKTLNLVIHLAGIKKRRLKDAPNKKSVTHWIMEIWSQTHKTEHQKRAIRCYFNGNIEKVNYLGLYAIRQAPQMIAIAKRTTGKNHCFGPIFFVAVCGLMIMTVAIWLCGCFEANQINIWP